MEFIKYFETFTEEKLKELEDEQKTYPRRIIKEDTEHPGEYREYINEIRNYDISNFKFNNQPFDFYIIPDEEFIEIIKNINKYIEVEIPLDLKFDFSYDPKNLNLIDFKKGIPKLLIGVGLGHKLYKFVIEKIKFVTSNYNVSLFAIKLWRSLMLDVDLYCFTSNIISGAIYKYQTNEEIKNYLDKIKEQKTYFKYNFDEIIFDEELQEKIKEIYGSVDIYTQGN